MPSALLPHTKVFLWIGLFFGAFFCLATPPFQSPDENRHFFRAYQLGAGVWRSYAEQGQVGGRVPRPLIDVVELTTRGVYFHSEAKVERARLVQAWRTPFDGSPPVFVDFPNAALNSPVSYAFCAPAMRAMRLFSARPLLMLYAGRFANLAAALLVTAAALQLLPRMRWTFLILALTPMTAFQRSSLSPDAAMNAVSLLILALALRFTSDDERWALDYAGGYRSIYLGASAWLGLTKHSYALLPLMLFGAPAARFRRGKGRELLLVAAVSLVPEVLWMWSNRGLPPLSLYGAVPALQARYILVHPARAAGTMLGALGQDAGSYLAEWAGVLGFLDTPLPAGFEYALVALLAATLFSERGEGPRPAPPAQLALLCVGGASLALIVASMYVVSTPPGAAYVYGIQGRYLIPAVPLFMSAVDGAIAAPAAAKPARLASARALAIGGSVASLAIALGTLLRRYYGLF